MSWLGIDGCKAGWLCVQIDAQGQVFTRLLASIAELEAWRQDVNQVLIDIPVGLPGTEHRGRECDRIARRRLGAGRGSSVFAPPARATLAARDYREALHINRQQTGKGISKQAWNITPKIREVDVFLRHHSEWQGRLRESHPELCFLALNRGQAMRHNKKTPAGQAERLAVLMRYLPDARKLLARAVADHRRREAQADDVIDALVLAVTARLGAGHYRTLPARPPRDACDLPMEMVYAEPDATAGAD